MARKRERVTLTLDEIRDVVASDSRGGHPDDFIPYTARPRLKRTDAGWVLELSWDPKTER